MGAIHKPSQRLTTPTGCLNHGVIYDMDLSGLVLEWASAILLFLECYRAGILLG
jgi:hypothetical protein